MHRWNYENGKKTKTTVIAYVYVSDDTSSVSVWCLHRAQTMLSSAQYFWILAILAWTHVKIVQQTNAVQEFAVKTIAVLRSKGGGAWTQQYIKATKRKATKQSSADSVASSVLRLHDASL